MDIIDNYNFKVFAGNVPATNVLSTFGSLKDASTEYSTDLDTIQKLNAWPEGWQSTVINSYWPALQDMNSAFYVPTNKIAYNKQSGIPEWNSAMTYYSGCIATDGLGGIYRSLVDDNLNQAFTNATKWFKVEGRTFTHIGADYNVLNTDDIIVWSTADTTNTVRYVKLPDPTADLSGRIYTIINYSGHSFSLTLTTVGGGAVFCPSFGTPLASLSIIDSFNSKLYCTRKVMCDATYWWLF